jgi:hypothetical protein
VKPEEIDDLLRREEALAWRPELTAAVMSGIRRERFRARWHLTAAAALILLAVGIGTLAVLDHLGSRDLALELSASVPRAESLPKVVEAGWSWVAGALESAALPLDLIPRSPGSAVAVAALILLLLVNGATLGRPALTRRRNP